MEKFSSLGIKKNSKNKKSDDFEKKSSKKNNIKSILIKKKEAKETPKIKNLEKFTLFFRIKSLIYLLKQDKKLKLLRFFIKRPIYHSFNLVKSYTKKTPFIKKQDDLYLFNLKSFNDLKKLLKDKNSLLVLGFSYCQKPKNCPKKRFSSDCIHDPNNSICKTCFISKTINSISIEDIFLVIPDVLYISEKLIEIKKNNPKKEIVFIIMTCNLSIHKFADNANMIKIKGLAIELSGRICVNNKSFLFAEKGLKPGFTNLSSQNEELVSEFLQDRF